MRKAQAGFAMGLLGDDEGRRGASSSSHAPTNGGPARRDAGPTSKRLTRQEAFGDHDDEPDIDRRRRADDDRALTGYSRSGAEWKDPVAKSRPKALVIAAQSDTDWMQERKKRLGLERHRQELGSLTGLGGRGGGTGGNSNGQVERIGDEEERTGLEDRSHRREERMNWNQQVEDPRKERPEGAGTPPGESAAHATLDEDQLARSALVSGNHSFGGNTAIRPQTIEMAEEEALQRDMESRPEAPTLSDYSAMPVEEFGAALLRGMGWKEGMGAGRQRQGPTSAPLVKKRAALLGLGAKERESSLPSTATAGERASHSSRRAQEQRRYVPIVRNDGRDHDRSRRSSTSPPSSRRDRHSSGTERRERRNDEDSSRGDRDRDRRSSRHHRDHDDHYERKRSDRSRDERRESGRREREAYRDERDRDSRSSRYASEGRSSRH